MTEALTTQTIVNATNTIIFAAATVFSDVMKMVADTLNFTSHEAPSRERIDYLTIAS
jgi:hypothetical protein